MSDEETDIVQLLAQEIASSIEGCTNTWGSEGVLRAQKVRELCTAYATLISPYFGKDVEVVDDEGPLTFEYTRPPTCPRCHLPKLEHDEHDTVRGTFECSCPDDIVRGSDSTPHPGDKR